MTREPLARRGVALGAVGAWALFWAAAAMVPTAFGLLDARVFYGVVMGVAALALSAAASSRRRR